jgi:hypothetical protein
MHQVWRGRYGEISALPNCQMSRDRRAGESVSEGFEQHAIRDNA